MLRRLAISTLEDETKLGKWFATIYRMRPSPKYNTCACHIQVSSCWRSCKQINSSLSPIKIFPCNYSPTINKSK